MTRIQHETHTSTRGSSPAPRGLSLFFYNSGPRCWSGSLSSPAQSELENIIKKILPSRGGRPRRAVRNGVQTVAKNHKKDESWGSKLGH
jgi:hypothetical protein